MYRYASWFIILALVGCASYLAPKSPDQKVAVATESLTAANNVYAKLLTVKKDDGTYLIGDREVACIDVGLAGAKAALVTARGSLGSPDADTLAEKALRASKALEEFLRARQGSGQSACEVF